MANLSSLLTNIIDYSSRSFVKKSLTGAGLGLGSYLSMQFMYEQFLAHLKTNFSQIADIFYAINLSGLDVGLSMIISAVGVRVYLNSQKVFIRKL